MWIVDPLDGTTNYVYSLPLSVVSICVTHNVVGYAMNYMAPIRHAMMRGVSAVGDYALSMRSVGSAALHLAWVAAGRLTAYWELGLHPVVE